MAKKTEGQSQLALWLVGWFVGWLVGWFVGWLAVWHGADGFTLAENLIFVLSFVLSCRRSENNTHADTEVIQGTRVFVVSLFTCVSEE